MPLGIVSSDQFDKELSNLQITKEIVRGRNNKPEVPEEIRALAAQEVIAGAKISDVAELVGLSKSSVSAYTNDATSCATYNKPDQKLKEANDNFRNKIKGLASDKLIAAIESISEESLAESKPQVASAVARDMSSIIKNIEPDLPTNQTNNQVIIYKPRMNKDEDYEVIDVQALD